MLDAEAKRRFPLHTEAMLTAGSIEEGLRASAREMATYAREHPGWTGVYVEFWTHASRRPELRRRVAEQHERLLDTVGGLLEDLVVVEVVDRRGRPVAPGVPGHKVLLTSLVSRVQPLLRYELTDSVTVAEGPNPLGLPYARIAAVDGRSDDIVTLPAPGGGRVAVHPFPQPVGAVRGAAGGPPVPGRARPRRAAGGGRAARVGPGRHPGPDPGRPGPRARRRRALPLRIEVTPVPRIDRDPGHGAKLKLVTSEGGSA